MRLGFPISVRCTGDPIDCDGYPKSRMPDSPPPVYHKHCKSCGTIWWTPKQEEKQCSFCGRKTVEEIA